MNIYLGAGDPPTLDPGLASDPYSLSIIRQLYSGLLTFDPDLNVVPDVASAMPSLSADGKTYTFTLRRGVRFINGQEVTSADFKYAIERAADPRLAGPLPTTMLPAGIFLGDVVGMKEKLSGAASEITGVVAPDPYTLAVTINDPKASFLARFASGPTFAVLRSHVESGEAWTEEPQGTGPYKLQKWERNRYITLARNTDYFGGAPETPIINILMRGAGEDYLEQYKAGDLDVVTLEAEQIDELSERNNTLARELRAIPGLSVTYLGFNIAQKPFDDPRVREAISRAIDRQALARSQSTSRLLPARSFLLPGVAGYKPLDPGELYNVARARQLIAESTYKSAGNVPRVQIFFSGQSVAPALAAVVSGTIGLDVGVQEVEWSDYRTGLEQGSYGMFLARADAAYPDPDAIIAGLFTSDSTANFTGFGSDEVDSLLTGAASEGDTGRRLAAYASVEMRAMSDFVAVPLFHSATYVLAKPGLRDLDLTAVGLLSLRNLKLGER